MSKKFLSVLVFLMAVLSVFAALPVSAQSSCTISTRSSNMRMRAGHSTTDALVGNMPRNVQLQAVERYVESLGGKKTRVWYRLLKEEAAPDSPYEQVWVGGSVKTKGDCVNISTASAAPATTDTGSAPAAAPAASGIVLPQAGAWGMTAGGTAHIECSGVGSGDFSTTDIIGTLPDVQIGISGESVVFDGVTFARDGNGTWNGFYNDSAIGASGTLYLRIESATSIVGDMVISYAAQPGCTVKVSFWGSPR